jgi:hypothetical protein
MNKISTVAVVVLFLLAPLAAQTITVVAPNGGETLTLGGSCSISWTTTGVSGNVKIQLRRPGGAIVGVIAPGVAHDGSPYAWTVGQTNNGTADAGNYRICVIALDGSASDVSDANFAIAGESSTEPEPHPSIDSMLITSPTGSDSWPLGSNRQIKWKLVGGIDMPLSGVTLSIYLYRNGTAAENLIGLIADGLGTSGPYLWEVGTFRGGTVPAGGGYQILIKPDNAGTSVPECFSSPFTIGNPVIEGSEWSLGHDFVIEALYMEEREGTKGFLVGITDTGNDFSGMLIISYYCNKMGLGNAAKARRRFEMRRGVQERIFLPVIDPSIFNRECGVNFVFRVNPDREVTETDYDNNVTRKKFCWNQQDGRFVQLRVGKNYTKTCEDCGVVIRPADTDSDGEFVRLRLEISVQNCGNRAIQGAKVRTAYHWFFRDANNHIDQGDMNDDLAEGIDIDPGQYRILFRTVRLRRCAGSTLTISLECGETGELSANNTFHCHPNFVGF